MPERLTEHLMAHHLLSAGQATAALESLRTSGASPDTALLEQGALTEAELLRALAEVSGNRTMDLFEFQVNREVSRLIPQELAERAGLVPLWVDADAAHLACVYPVPHGPLEQIGALLEKRVEPWISLEVRIRDWMRALYGTTLSEACSSLLDRLNGARVAPARMKQTTDFSEETTLEEALRRQLLDTGPQRAVGDLGPLAAPSSPPHDALAAGGLLDFSVADAAPEWTLAQARAALREATGSRDQIIQVALRFARCTFDFAAMFAVLRGAASLWAVRGELPEQLHLPLSIPIDAASVFRTVCSTGRSYVGPLPPDPLTRTFLEQLGRSPRTILAFPLEVSGRVVAILYGDCAQRPMSRRGLSDFLLFCQDLPPAFEELIASSGRAGRAEL